MTSCGRLVALAQEMIGRLLVVVARIAPGLQISSRFSKSGGLDREVLRDRLDHDVDRREVVELRGAGQVGQRLGLGRLLELAALDRLVERALDRGADAVDLGVGAPDVGDVEPGLGEDLDDAGRHGAGADDADRRDRPPQLRRVGGVGRVRVGDDDRAVGALVGVEAAAGLAAEHARGDQLLEDRGGRVQAVAALLVHRVEDLVRRVEADQVEQRQRAHRVAAAEPHGGVDVLAGGEPALVHRDRVVEVAEQQGVGDEAGPVTDRSQGSCRAGRPAPSRRRAPRAR